MPLPDDGFDVALCQMSLQFFPDKVGALEEMKRVVAPGGRVALNTPGDQAPIFEIFEDVLGRHVGPEPVGFLHTVFALDDPDLVGGLLEDAGLRQVESAETFVTIQLPRPEEFLWQYLYATPLAAVVSQLDDDTLGAIERDVAQEAADLVADGGVRFAQSLVVATARV